MTDVTILKDGSICIFNLQTLQAKEWVYANVDITDETQWFGRSGLVVEPRYACDLDTGMIDAGLKVA